MKPALLMLTYFTKSGGALAVVMMLLSASSRPQVLNLSMHFPTPGNLVEWRYPPDVNLEGIEFKSIASGLHNVPKDFM